MVTFFCRSHISIYFNGFIGIGRSQNVSTMAERSADAANSTSPHPPLHLLYLLFQFAVIQINAPALGKTVPVQTLL